MWVFSGNLDPFKNNKNLLKIYFLLRKIHSLQENFRCLASGYLDPLCFDHELSKLSADKMETVGSS